MRQRVAASRSRPPLSSGARLEDFVGAHVPLANDETTVQPLALLTQNGEDAQLKFTIKL